VALDESLHCTLRQSSPHKAAGMALRAPHSPSRANRDSPRAAPRGVFVGGRAMVTFRGRVMLRMQAGCGGASRVALGWGCNIGTAMKSY